MFFLNVKILFFNYAQASYSHFSLFCLSFSIIFLLVWTAALIIPVDHITVLGEAIDMSGICQLGDDIGIDAATDVSILVLCWRLGAKGKPGHVMEQEWLDGMEALGADSTDKVTDDVVND